MLEKLSLTRQTRPPQDGPHENTDELSEKRRRSGSMRDTMRVPGFMLITVIFCCKSIAGNTTDVSFSNHQLCL